jgi:23S rRNA (cytosine1962-C5)-methyltransferase
MSQLATLILKKNEERRLRAGHLWVYSNEVDTQKSPLNQFSPGQAALFLDAQNKPLGLGYVNPHSLICGRLISRSPDQPFDRSLLVHRINIALSLRERVFHKPFYRLVYGESDFLPGLIVDRYGDTLVVQITTAGMEQAKENIIEALCKVLKPRGILLRNDHSMRELEQLESYVSVAYGEVDDVVIIEENDSQFHVPVTSGQKTGWFYDHRINRQTMRQYVHGKRVLDLFSYIGGWGVQAATAGASEVFCVDASSFALDHLEESAKLNHVDERITCIQGDVFEALKSLRQEKERFDVVIADPPAFIPRKKDIKNGVEAYRRVNQMAMQLLAKDGLLISASCSYHLSYSVLKDLLLSSSRHLDRNLQIFGQGHQGPDHPVHPAIEETDYLKAYFCRVLPVS